MRYATFDWLSKQYVRGFRGTRAGKPIGAAWDKSLMIVSLYRNGIGAKEISRHLFGTHKELPAVLDCVKRHGAFEVGRKPPGSKSFAVREPEAFKQREYDRLVTQAFMADQLESRRAESSYKWALNPGREWEAQARRIFRDPKLKIKFYLRKRLRHATKSKRKVRIPTDDLMGCSPEELRAHLEGQFKPGWTWDNYGKVWQIDHITPCAAFDLTDNEQAKKCFHFTNLRPLCKWENFKKNDRMSDGTRASAA